MTNSNPSSSEQLEVLALRCEQATGPNARLNMEISLAIGGTIPSGFQMQYDGTRVPSYTASIDAAMQLVPHGWPSRCVGTTDDGAAYAQLAGNDGFMMIEDADEFFVEASAATPALALCAAALRSRSTPLEHLEGGE